MKGKELLKEKGLIAFERKCIYEKIVEIIKEKMEYFIIEDIIVFDNEISFIFDASGVEDWEDLDYDDWLNFVEILEVRKYDVEKLMKENNVKFEKSNVSESVYFELDGKEYRLSTHKRPAYQDESGIWHEWDYENQIICENEIEMYKEIEKILGGKLNESYC